MMSLDIQSKYLGRRQQFLGITPDSYLGSNEPVTSCIALESQTTNTPSSTSPHSDTETWINVIDFAVLLYMVLKSSVPLCQQFASSCFSVDCLQNRLLLNTRDLIESDPAEQIQVTMSSLVLRHTCGVPSLVVFQTSDDRPTGPSETPFRPSSVQCSADLKLLFSSLHNSPIMQFASTIDEQNFTNSKMVHVNVTVQHGTRLDLDFRQQGDTKSSYEEDESTLHAGLSLLMDREQLVTLLLHIFAQSVQRVAALSRTRLLIRSSSLSADQRLNVQSRFTQLV
ncbi:uncharacterized protein V6R79_015730 [Siganus canaliculatus]